VHVAPVRLEGNKPAAIDKSLGRVDRAFPIPDGVGAVDMDIARADGGLGPVLEPVEQFLCGILVRWFDPLFGRPSSSESFEQVHVMPGVLLL